MFFVLELLSHVVDSGDYSLLLEDVFCLFLLIMSYKMMRT